MNKKIGKITLSSLMIALYVIFMYVTQTISFGQYQVRLATGLYGFVYEFPFLCVPFGIANMLSNILIGGDIINGIFGFFAGLLTTLCICIFKKITNKKVILVLPIAIIPSLIISIWLSLTLQINYLVIFFSLLIGQTISAYSTGIFILYISERLHYVFHKNE